MPSRPLGSVALSQHRGARFGRGGKGLTDIPEIIVPGGSQAPAGRRAPPQPGIRLSLGVTGHRLSNAAYAANVSAVAQTLSSVFDIMARAVAATPPPAAGAAPAPVRLHSMMVDGFDQMASHQALERGWELVAPLPFGQALNASINARPESAEEAGFLLTGQGACSAGTLARAQDIAGLLARARVFALADADETITALHLALMEDPGSVQRAQAYSVRASERVALAARVMIEQSDLIIGVWDGASTSFVGGTGHTIALALEMGAPVLWIDAGAPERWRILNAPESLAVSLADDADSADLGDREAALIRLVQEALQPTAGKKPDPHLSPLQALKALDAERWRARSNPFWHGYRRIEALFGADDLKGRLRNLTQTYETPEDIAGGSAAPLLAAARDLPGQDGRYVDQISSAVLRRFAWADGIAARLSDTYRGGMILSFLFSALAIVGGIAYLPFASSHEKWMFALFELALLGSILLITAVGQKRRWHGRWFETRRVAEYFRHAPILLLLGVARPPGRWPRGAHTSWPEWYALHGLRDVGLPPVSITPAYLRETLETLLLDHVVRQRDYHRYKARRLSQAHHNLDKLSEGMFVLAVASVSAYLLLKGGGAMHWIDKHIAASLSYGFTFLGVLLPTFGASIAGIRYFGDFERFSAISEVTAEKLDTVASRIDLLLKAPEAELTYGRVSELAHAADDIVVSEIESWQAVFGGKHIAVPV